LRGPADGDCLALEAADDARPLNDSSVIHYQCIAPEMIVEAMDVNEHEK
jgi:hypothetical protein